MKRWEKLSEKIAKCYVDENGDELSEEYLEGIDLIKNAYYIDFFDGVGIYITSDYFELNKGFYSEVCNSDFEISNLSTWEDYTNELDIDSLNIKLLKSKTLIVKSRIKKINHFTPQIVID